jgi:hypothetical protein
MSLVPSPAFVYGLMALGVLTGLRPALAVLVFTAALGVAVLAVLPRHWLPSVALVAFALLPVKWLPVPDLLSTVTPSALVLAVWAVRLLAEERLVLTALGRSRRPRVALAVVAGLWLVVTTVTSASPAVSLGWALSFTMLVLVPSVFAVFEPRAGMILLRSVAALTAVLGLAAAVETWVLQANPLLQRFYAAAGPADSFTQIWSVYRATTTLGHPLVNGAFFTTTTCLALGGFLLSRRAPWLAAVALGAAGVVASGSRGAALGLALGVLVTAVLEVRARPDDRVARALLAGPLLAGAAMALLLQHRASTADGPDSLAYRLKVLTPGIDVASRNPLLGTGPGTAGYLKSEQSPLVSSRSGFDPIPELSFENSWLELLIGIAVPGVVLLITLVLLVGWQARLAQRSGVAGAVVAWTVTAGTFNLVEGHRPALMLFGALVVAAVSAPDGRPPDTDPRPRGATTTHEARGLM